MGWFDGASEHSSSHHHHHKSSSGKHHSHSHHSSSPRVSGIFGLGEASQSKHHNASRSSFFGLGDAKHHNHSRSSFFGFPTTRSSTSSYRRSPRKGYLNRIYYQLRRLLRDLLYYMKRHPMKVFMLVIMPLLTSGAVAGLLAKLGIRLPGGIERMFGMAAGGGLGRDRHGGMQFERTRVEGSGLGRMGGGGGMGGIERVVGGMGGIGGAVSLAKMFM